MAGERLLQAFLSRYAEAEADAVAPFVVGRKVLDLGAGEGYVGRALSERTGLWTCSVDVGSFRRAAGPYVTYDGTRLPFADATFDTTLLLLALHHCTEPEAVLDEAVRVTRSRVIILESIYRNRLERFWLDRLDGWLNAYRHGGRMNVPFAFKRPAEWQELFRWRGLRTVETRWLGSWWERLVHHPLLFVLEKRWHVDVDSGNRGNGSRTRIGGASPEGRHGRPRSAHGALRPTGLAVGLRHHPERGGRRGGGAGRLPEPLPEDRRV